MKRLVIIILLLLFGLIPHTLQAEPVVVGPDTDGVWLGRNLEIARDDAQAFTLESLVLGQHESAFFKINQDVPTLGYFQGDHYWARFTLRNPTDQPLDLFLSPRYATVDYLTLFWPDAKGQYQSLMLGDCVAYSKRVVENRNPVFPIRVPPGDHTYYLRMHTTTAVQFSLALWAPRKFLNYETKESHYLGLLFGVCFVMFFYNLFVSIKFNSRAYAAYVSYIFLYTMFASLYHGVLQQYLFPDMENGWLFKHFIFVSIDLMSISCATFSIEFLELRKSAPRLYRYLFIFRLILALNVLNWLTLGWGAKHMTLVSNFFFSSSLIFIGFYRSLSYRPARYYTLGWTIFLTSNLIMLLGNNAVIDTTAAGAWAQFTGAVLELVLLSLALGERVALINSERQEGLLHQQTLQEQLIQSERDKAAAHASLLLERENHIRGLDRLVFERTRDIQSIMATINQGILTIGIKDGHLHVGAEHSQYLGTMLDTRHIHDLDPFELIFSRSNLSSEVIDQSRQVLFSCIGIRRSALM